MKDEAPFNDISPILKYQDIKKHSLVTIDNLINLHTQLLELANKVIPKKKPFWERVKDSYVDPFLSSKLSTIIFFSGYAMNIGILFAETNEEFYDKHFCMIIFFEIISYFIILLITTCRFIIHGSHYWKYFWNYICIGCLIVTPLYYLFLLKFSDHEDLILTFKILRLALIFRIINLYHPTRILFHSIIKSLLNISLISYLILLFIIISAFIANSLFKEISKDFFGSIQKSMYTIFIILSQSGWLQSYRKVTNEYPNISKLFYICIGFFGSFVLMNSFTGISLISMNKAKRIQEKDNDAKRLEKSNKLERTKTLNKLLARKKSLERIEKFGNIDLNDLKRAHNEMEIKLKRLSSLYVSLDTLTEEVFKVSHDEYERVEKAASLVSDSGFF
ncbi:hypothetical protein M9Y10_004833 [Tritrichomonas musculus]|uniref:Ion transport domain-containing protein n=1 Tax=Tritrichomonas musculus TaxID=1915356 RepID=A0ABR2JK09_9EUKA